MHDPRWAFSSSSVPSDKARMRNEEGGTPGCAASFGDQLDRFRATPTRSRRVTRSSSRSADTRTKPGVIEDNAKDEESDVPVTPSPSVAKASMKLESRSTTSKSSRKRKRNTSDVRSFEGMAEVPDRLARNLDILFCGFNPGMRSSEAGFHYAHPSNRFYRILHASGLTPHRLAPSESPSMPELYKLGLTDLHRKCTARADQVPSAVFQAGAGALLEKLILWQPKTVCFVGMDVYRNFRKHFPAHLIASKPNAVKTEDQRSDLHADDVTASPAPIPSKMSKSRASDVQLGLQKLVLAVRPPYSSEPARQHIRLFVIPSTSGLAAGYTDAQRVTLLQELKQIVASIDACAFADAEDAIILDAEAFLDADQMKLEALHVGPFSEPAQMTAKKEEE